MQDWICSSCQHGNPPAARFCGGCGLPRPGTDLSLTGERTSAGVSPATPRPSSPPDLSISGAQTFADATSRNDSAATPSTALHPGLRVGRDARYELLSKLGEGGMGAVWKARDTQLGREVAIKRILGHASPMLRERFQRETQAVTGLRHPNIVTVFDAGEDAFGLYLVMEFVPGQTLAAQLHKGSLPAAAAVATMQGLCRGAAHAHKKGVVHRDIKPGNVIVDDDGVPRLLDFGLVRLDGASELSMTGVGMGTLDYAAPEQKRDASKADARSDVYALGLVFYELLTGLRPPVTLKRAPEAWRALIEKATDGVAADRHASAEELLADLDAVQAQAASDTFASQLLGSDDDLRCPKCKLLNTLEAKFCRACSTSLRADCPACSKPVRVGLKRCDQCAAEVAVVVQLRDGLAALKDEIGDGKLADASSRLQALQPLAESDALGPATHLASGWRAQQKDLQTREQQAQQALASSEEALARQDVPRAEQQWQRACDLDQRLLAQAATWQQRLATARDEWTSAEAAVKGAFAAVAAEVEAGHLAAAERAIGGLVADLDPLRSVWHGAWARQADALRKEIARRRDKAVERVRAGEAALGQWADEDAVAKFGEAKALDDAHTDRADAVAAASAGRIAKRDAALSQLQANLRAVKDAVAARDLEAAQRARAALVAVPWRDDVPIWETPIPKTAEADRLLAALQADYEAAAQLLAESEVQLAALEDEEALRLLVRAAALRPAYGIRHAATHAASGPRIAARDAARRQYEQSVAALKAAIASGQSAAARDAVGDLDGVRARVGAQWWAQKAQERDAVLAAESELAQAARVERANWRKALMVAGLVIAVTCGLVVKAQIDARQAEERRIAAVAAEAERQRLEVEAAERARVAADTKAIEVASAAVQQGKTQEFLSVRALQARLPNDPRVVALAQQTNVAASAWLERCLRDLGPRLQRGDDAAYAEWQALSGWFGSDPRLEPLREAAAAAAAAAAADRLRRAGLAAAPGSARDAATGLPRKVVHTATGAELVLIAAGEFTMGSPAGESQRDSDEVQHRRQIRKPFYLGVTEVTQAQWRKVMGSNPSRFQGDELPVEQVSWEDCQQFLQKAGGVLRLPSEAEWEYACRAGSTTPFSFGATITPEQVNYDGNYPYGGASHGLYRERTVAAGSLPANAWGLYEMHGNVWEWCQDGYEAYPSSGTEEPSRAAGARVLRGGSWNYFAILCRAANRNWNEPGNRSIYVGLRLARTLPE